MRKYKAWIMALIMITIGGAPFYMSLIAPDMAATWLASSTVVFFVIIGAAVATFVDGKLDLRRQWSEYNPSKGIKIHLDSAPLKLWSNGRIVDLHITHDKLLWISDRHLNGSEVITRAKGAGETVSLEAGTFRITSERHGYKVTFPQGQIWELK